MVQTCSKCSRANPPDAVYCYYDGLVLGGHARNGGPVAVGAQAFASPFVFPSGKACRSFNELALACQEDWSAARDLLQQGYLETFLGGLGRIDLVVAAKEAVKYPDRDRGLDQFLSKLPADVLDPPKLAAETQEVNLGVLKVGDAGRSFKLHLENKGMRLLYGTVSCADAPWLTLGDGPGTTDKHFQFGHELALPVRVVGDRLRAANKPLEAQLTIESNGGSATLTIRAQVPVKPFPDGVLAGATTPRKIAEKAKAHPKEAGVHFERGEVAAWYKENGWTYPVQGPAATGMAAVQQFFEALGLTPAPKVQINVKSISLTGAAGQPLRYLIEVRTEERKPIYAHGTSNQPWLEVGRPKINGRLATVPLSVPSVPNKPGQRLTASVTVQSNGNQRFIVPVTLDVAGGNVFAFDEPAPAPEPEPELVEVEVPEVVEEVEVVQAAPSPVATAPARPPTPAQVQVPPPAPASIARSYSRYRPQSKPAWAHVLPAALLIFALLIVAAADIIARAFSGGGTVPPTDGGGQTIEGDPEHWKFTNLKDPDPKLLPQFSEDKHFGLQMIGVPDPRPEYASKYKKLTYAENGRTNNTIASIGGYEYFFGERTPDNKIVSNKELTAPRHGDICVMDFGQEKVRVKQHTEIVPSHLGVLDTCLVWYHIENYGGVPEKVGIRFLLDTYIGANDGVPFAAPGVKGLIDDKRDFKGSEMPPYLEAVEGGDDKDHPGTVARLGLKNIRLPGVTLESPDEVIVCQFPGERQRWDPPQPLRSIKEGAKSGDKGDSAVLLYWPVQELKPKGERDVGFTYGLSELDISTEGAGLALSTPDTVAPELDFLVTAYVYNGTKGEEVELTLPTGLTFAAGEKGKKALDESGKRVLVSWKVHAGPAAIYPIQATAGGSKAKHDVVVKSSSIFG
jgi:hypothetical protein